MVEKAIPTGLFFFLNTLHSCAKDMLHSIPNAWRISASFYFMPHAQSCRISFWETHRPVSRYGVLGRGRSLRLFVNAGGIAWDAEHPGNRTPETQRVVVGKKDCGAGFRSKSPGARIAEWVSRERSGRRRSVGYADRTEHEMRSE